MTSSSADRNGSAPAGGASRSELLVQLGTLDALCRSRGWDPVIPFDVAAELFPTADLADLIRATKDHIMAIVRAEDEASGTP